jgi:hypothetical protein
MSAKPEQEIVPALFLFLAAADSDSLEAWRLKSIKIKPNRRGF